MPPEKRKLVFLFTSLCLLLLLPHYPPVIAGIKEDGEHVESVPIDIWHLFGDTFTIAASSTGGSPSTPLLTTDIIIDGDRAYPLGEWTWTNSGIPYFDTNNVGGRASLRRINPITHDHYWRGQWPFGFYDPAFITFDVSDGNVYAIVYSADYDRMDPMYGPTYHGNLVGFAIWRDGEYDYSYLYPFKEDFEIINWLSDGFSVKYCDGLVFVSKVDFNMYPQNNAYTMIFDVSDLSDVRLLANFSYDYNPCDSRNDRILVLKVEDYLYIARTWGEVDIIDVSDASNPVKLRSVNMNSSIFDMKYDSNQRVVYVAGGIQGIKIFNASDPSEPILQQTYNSTLKCSLGVEIINEEVLAVGDSVFGVHILNVSNIEGIYEISSIKTNDRAYHLSHSNNKLFVADMNGGMYVIDVTDMENPQSICTQIIIGPKLIYECGIRPLAASAWGFSGAFLTFWSEKMTLMCGNPEGMYSIMSALDFYPGTLVLYNDTDDNHKLTTVILNQGGEMEGNDTEENYKLASGYGVLSQNPSIMFGRAITDQVYCVGDIWGSGHAIPPSNWILENCIRDGVNAIKASVKLTGIPLENRTSIELGRINNCVGGQGRANVSMVVWFVPKLVVKDTGSVLNVTIKLDFVIEFYDLELYGNPETFSVYLLFFATGMAGVYGGYPAYSIIEGYDMPKYSLIAHKEIGFICSNTTAAIGEDDTNRVENVYISNDYGGVYLELTEIVFLGLNFHNITCNSKIYYDPQISIWLNYIPPGAVMPDVLYIAGVIVAVVVLVTFVVFVVRRWRRRGK